MSRHGTLVDRCDVCGSWLRPMTAEQHRAVEAIYGDIAEQLDWPRGSGIKHDPSVWHELMVAAYVKTLGRKVLFLPTLDGDGLMPVFRAKQSRLTVKQGAELKHFARAWAIDNGVQLYEPEREPA